MLVLCTGSNFEKVRISDFVDKHGGAYDSVTETGHPQPPQVKEDTTRSQRAQLGAGCAAEPPPGPDEGNYPLPEGLRKERHGPLNKDTGRRPKGLKAPRPRPNYLILLRRSIALRNRRGLEISGNFASWRQNTGQLLATLNAPVRTFSGPVIFDHLLTRDSS